MGRARVGARLSPDSRVFVYALKQCDLLTQAQLAASLLPARSNRLAAACMTARLTAALTEVAIGARVLLDGRWLTASGIVHPAQTAHRNKA